MLFSSGADHRLDIGAHINVNWWNWRPTVELLRGSGVDKSDEDWTNFSDGFGDLDAKEVAIAIAYLEPILAGLKAGGRIKLDGEITYEPDDFQFHKVEVEKNYGATREWLENFVAFLKAHKGGVTF